MNAVIFLIAVAIVVVAISMSKKPTKVKKVGSGMPSEPGRTKENDQVINEEKSNFN